MRKTDGKKKYIVSINGRNFLMRMDGKIRKAGFYTTRFVEAQDVEEAEAVAIGLIRSDAKLSSSILNRREDPPILTVEEIEEVKKLQSQEGYAFYPEEEETL